MKGSNIKVLALEGAKETMTFDLTAIPTPGGGRTGQESQHALTYNTLT